LAINGTMFVAELAFGIFAQSTGLIADSLDMLADALVYGISLYAVGKAAAAKDNAARVSGRTFGECFLSLVNIEASPRRKSHESQLDLLIERRAGKPRRHRFGRARRFDRLALSRFGNWTFNLTTRRKRSNSHFAPQSELECTFLLAPSFSLASQ
ncbi:MAG: cation transporter, partial [Bdellovibrionales bacterium]|nr:cation transporter [Bdellovibrionales bacterium]